MVVGSWHCPSSIRKVKTINFEVRSQGFGDNSSSRRNLNDNESGTSSVILK